MTQGGGKGVGVALPVLELVYDEKRPVHCRMAMILIFIMIHVYFLGLEAVTQTISWPHEGWKFYVSIGGPSPRSNCSRDIKFPSQISRRNRKTFEVWDWVSWVFFNWTISGESLFRPWPSSPPPKSPSLTEPWGRGWYVTGSSLA